MSFPTTRREGAVSVIALTEPHARLSLKDLQWLTSALEEASRDSDSAAILVSGPPGTFCSGGDLGDFLRCGNLDELASTVRRFFRSLMAGDKPLIAAVDGAAIGLGMTMLLHFDAVFATPESSFIAPFANLGLVPEAGSTLLAPARFGHLRAFGLLCLGKSLTAAEAQAMGLVSEVTPSRQSFEHASTVASRLARLPRDALQTTRRLLRGNVAEIEARIELEIGHFRRQLEDVTTIRRLTRITRMGAQQSTAAA